jgi:hypothetical protein
MIIGSFSSSGSTYRFVPSPRNLGSVNYVGGKDYTQMLAAVKTWGGALEDASEALRGDRELVLAAVKTCGGALEYASEALRGDRELVLVAVSQDWRALEHASEALRGDRDFILKVVQQNGLALKWVGDNLKQDEFVVIEAVSNNGFALEYASDKFRGDRELVMEAVRQSGLVLEHASEELRGDRELVIQAVRCSCRALGFASEKLRGDHGVVMEAVRRNPMAFQYANEALRGDRELVLEAVKQYGNSLRYASEALRGDRELVLEAVKQDVDSLRYVSGVLRGDREVVLAAVSQNWRVLKHESEALRGDCEVVLAAVRQNGEAYSFATAKLKEDQSFFLKAVSQNRNVLNHAPKKFNKDKDLMRAAKNQSDEAWECVPRTMNIRQYLHKLDKVFTNFSDDARAAKLAIKIAKKYSDNIFFNGSADALVQATDKIDLSEFEKPNDLDITIVVDERYKDWLVEELIKNDFLSKSQLDHLGFQLYMKNRIEIKVVTEYRPSNLAPFQNYTRVSGHQCELNWPADSFGLFRNRIMALRLYSNTEQFENSNDNAAMRMIGDIIQKGFDWREDDLDNYAQYLKGFFKNKQHKRYFTDKKFNKNKFENELNNFLKKHQSCLDKNLDGLNRVHRLMTKMKSHKDLKDHNDDIGKILSVIETAKNKITPREVGSLNQSTEGVSSSSSCSVPHHGQSWGQQLYYGQAPFNSQAVYSGSLAGTYQSTWPENGGYLGMPVGPSPFFVPDPNQFFHR